MTLTLAPLRPEHLPDAAALVCASINRLRARVPLAPERYERPEEIIALLRPLAEAERGAIATELHGHAHGTKARFFQPADGVVPQLALLLALQCAGADAFNHRAVLGGQAFVVSAKKRRKITMPIVLYPPRQFSPAPRKAAMIRGPI